MRALSSGVLFLFAQAAIAVPLTWTFNDAYLSNGAQIAGSFVFDADTPGAGGYAGVSVTVFGDGKQSRDFVYIAPRFLDAPGPGGRAESSLIANLVIAAAAFTHGLEQQHQIPAMTRVGSRTGGHLA